MTYWALLLPQKNLRVNIAHGLYRAFDGTWYQQVENGIFPVPAASLPFARVGGD